MQPNYSQTPLHKKLGYKPGMRILLKQAPAAYVEWLGDYPRPVTFLQRFSSNLDMVHLFVANRTLLVQQLDSALKAMNRDGMTWVSWPKKSSGVESEITEDTIREIALPMGLVDVKVCAVSDIWSGLKLVIRKQLR